jgi:hypothetical protein
MWQAGVAQTLLSVLWQNAAPDLDIQYVKTGAAHGAEVSVSVARRAVVSDGSSGPFG